MTKPSYSYGFSYEFDGKKYSFSVLALSEENAKQRVAAMARATLDGRLRYAEESCGTSREIPDRVVD